MGETIVVEGLSNREFLERYAHPGRIGVLGGFELTTRLIRRAQRRQIADGQHSPWSHVFIFQGPRSDGHHWIIESDIDIRPKHYRLGVQENRIDKYFNDARYATVGIIDLGLTAEQEGRLLKCALDLVAAGARYSLREIIGTVWALRHPSWRPRENLLAREQAFYCSAFVRHVFEQAGVLLALGVSVKNTTPEDIAATAALRRKWLLMRPAPAIGVREIVRTLRANIRRREAATATRRAMLS
jgi:hypothetical protein